MYGYFHTVVVEPLDDTLQETMDKDNYWNRGHTAKYILEPENTALVKSHMDASPRTQPTPQSRTVREGRVEGPFTHINYARSTHGLTQKDLKQPAHEPVFDE